MKLKFVFKTAGGHLVKVAKRSISKNITEKASGRRCGKDSFSERECGAILIKQGDVNFLKFMLWNINRQYSNDISIFEL
ncbi:MAG: hypothetical protein AB8V98_01930 [Coxiella endosymbiont of Dermacentor silvarum]